MQARRQKSAGCFNFKEEIKMRKFLLPVLLLVVGLFVFAACGRDDDTADSPLVGGWDFQSTPWYTFNADGTGTRPTHLGTGGNDSFNWSTRNGVLTITLTAGPVFNNAALTNVESWNYTISGSVLTLASNQVADEIWDYTRRN